MQVEEDWFGGVEKKPRGSREVSLHLRLRI
jgi:hypothetical protein